MPKKRAEVIQLFWNYYSLFQVSGFNRDRSGTEFPGQSAVLCQGRLRSPSLQAFRSTARQRRRSQIWCRSWGVKIVELIVTDCFGSWQGWSLLCTSAVNSWLERSFWGVSLFRLVPSHFFSRTVFFCQDCLRVFVGDHSIGLSGCQGFSPVPFYLLSKPILWYMSIFRSDWVVVICLDCRSYFIFSFICISLMFIWDCQSWIHL